MTFWFGFGIGVGLLPAALGVATVVSWLHSGWWTAFPSDRDEYGCDACRRVPDAQRSPICVCPRCGRRQVRTYLVRVFGGRLLDRLVKRGPRDEAWLNGETE